MQYVFSEKEMEAIKKAYNWMYEQLDRGASTLQDYFPSKEAYLEFERVRCMVNGEVFYQEDYE